MSSIDVLLPHMRFSRGRPVWRDGISSQLNDSPPRLSADEVARVAYVFEVGGKATL
jgi:hypothetical protein